MLGHRDRARRCVAPIRQEYARLRGHSAGALIHALLKTVPYFVGPLFPDFPQTRFKKDGPTPAAAAWLDVAVSRAEFVRALCIGLTSAVERIADLGRTSREVRKSANKRHQCASLDHLVGAAEQRKPALCQRTSVSGWMIVNLQD
jgi:hypothetical protein